MNNNQKTTEISKKSINFPKKSRKINENNLFRHIKIKHGKEVYKLNSYLSSIPNSQVDFINSLVSRIKLMYKNQYEYDGDGYYFVRIKLANSNKLLIPIPRKYTYVLETKINQIINQFIHQKIMPFAYLVWVTFDFVSYKKIEQIISNYTGLFISASKLYRILKRKFSKKEKNTKFKSPSKIVSLFIDGIFVNTNNKTTCRKKVLIHAIGIDEYGSKIQFPPLLFNSENTISYKTYFRYLKRLGLERINLVVSDTSLSVSKAIKEEFSETLHQTCLVHLRRNLDKILTTKFKAFGSKIIELIKLGNPKFVDDEISRYLPHSIFKKIKRMLKIGSYFTVPKIKN